ncbi:Mrp/NBP35 family ATP-binding protein [candidate division WOR-3 bacterium]|nr:Mrp/NBP35 family ATP-binding protein [candidate division WOR-3 bacterium]
MSGIGDIKHKIMVLSGKGGVGKSTVSVNLALSLKKKGYRVGLLDIDIHGPSIPHLLNIPTKTLKATEDNKLVPIDIDGMKVISIGFLLDSDNRAVIWRGPLKYKILLQFLNDVVWGELDYLIIDSPPGTGDEPLTLLQNVKDLSGALIVSTPQDIALLDVKKAIDFVNQMGMKTLGLVENMSGFKCPNCGTVTHIFGKNAHQKLQKHFDIEHLISIPLTDSIVSNSDSGIPAIKDPDIEKVFNDLTDKIVAKMDND